MFSQAVGPPPPPSPFAVATLEAKVDLKLFHGQPPIHVEAMTRDQLDPLVNTSTGWLNRRNCFKQLPCRIQFALDKEFLW